MAALLCHGGMVVATQTGLAGDTYIAVQSTVQPDGDVTLTVSRPAFGNEAVLLSHLAEVETRVHAVARVVRRIGWAVHGIVGAVLIAVIGATYSWGDVLGSAISVFLSTALVLVLRTSRFRGLLLTFAIQRLSRVTGASGPPSETAP